MIYWIASSEKDIQYLILSDGIKGWNCPDERIKLIKRERGTLKAVVGKGLRYLNSLPSKIRPIILITTGNKDIIPEELKITRNSTAGNEKAIKKYSVNKISQRNKIFSTCY